MSKGYDLSKEYGRNVFTNKVMRERLPKDVYKSLDSSIKNMTLLDPSIAGVVANAMKEWALEKGATHYSHWFQPMTGVTAEKQEAFLNFQGERELVLEFSGKELIKGEPDASSFPNGGVRATFEARGYTAWDPTSPAFIKGHVLYIPTAFCSYSGESLDKKTPLLRSLQALNKQGARILKLFGAKENVGLAANVGAEQEYFLVDSKIYNERPDLIYSGKTLFGAPPAKGQDLDDHYFGIIKERVSDFMQDLDEHLWSFGIASKTRHNEVAPGQHELAPIFEDANTATDHNQLIMETLKSVAPKHGLVCLTNEKPFAGVNGSGKHCNWSISTTEGENLLNPGKTPAKDARFLLFLCAVIKAVDLHQDLLRTSVATASNDLRLGGDEAPPAIISIFLGDELTEILESIEKGSDLKSHSQKKMDIGVDVLPLFTMDTTDRNRTSPFAFTGNKFEFRMVGSSQSISGPLFTINTMVADVLKGFADTLENAKDFNKALTELIRQTCIDHSRIIFNGNNYSAEWEKEAEKRGLLNLKKTPDAMPYFKSPENIALFERHEVLSKIEVEARTDLILEGYAKVLHIEALAMLELVHNGIISAVVDYSASIADAIRKKQKISDKLNVDLEINMLERLSNLSGELDKCISNLEDVLENIDDDDEDHYKLAEYYGNEVNDAMVKLRKVVDSLEELVDSAYWPLPSYGDILYSVK